MIDSCGTVHYSRKIKENGSKLRIEYLNCKKCDYSTLPTALLFHKEYKWNLILSCEEVLKYVKNISVQQLLKKYTKKTQENAAVVWVIV